jgi:hypothetical protein
MSASAIYIAISIAALAIAAVLVFWLGRKRGENRLRPLAGLAFAFIVARIFFGEERLVRYSLIGIGVVLAFVDILSRTRTQ